MPSSRMSLGSCDVMQPVPASAISATANARIALALTPRPAEGDGILGSRGTPHANVRGRRCARRFRVDARRSLVVEAPGVVLHDRAGRIVLVKDVAVVIGVALAVFVAGEHPRQKAVASAREHELVPAAVSAPALGPALADLAEVSVLAADLGAVLFEHHRFFYAAPDLEV